MSQKKMDQAIGTSNLTCDIEIIYLVCIDSDDETQMYGIDMSRWFCFAQSTTGKILGVFYPKNEDVEIVNFKKSIASTFQANFKGTTEEDEGDSQSFHRSHYR